ncbi:MAG: hypothetical protein HZB87_05520 [Desulfatitalea sp.]|nr:hypothetical protein [Desulfatitalea sp.]MBI5896736.1 hypothetical protein [Desulfobacterales bacterium]
MTFSLLIKIAIPIVIAVIVVARRRNSKSAVCADMDQIRTSDWGGWIEIANTDYAPLFQGKMVATAQDHAGALLFGVLVEENAPAPLVAAIKAGPCTYLTEGRVLARGLTAHDKKLIVTKLEDADMIDRLSAAMDQGVQPDTCLVLNSVEIQHMDTPEAVAQFEKVWEDSQAKAL